MRADLIQFVPCSLCNGEGEVRNEYYSESPCPQCHGTGIEEAPLEIMNEQDVACLEHEEDSIADKVWEKK